MEMMAEKVRRIIVISCIPTQIRCQYVTPFTSARRLLPYFSSRLGSSACSLVRPYRSRSVTDPTFLGSVPKLFIRLSIPPKRSIDFAPAFSNCQSKRLSVFPAEGASRSSAEKLKSSAFYSEPAETKVRCPS